MNFGLPTGTLGSGLSLVRVLGSVSRTLGVLRQFAPIYRDIKPLLRKAPIVLERLNNFRVAPQNIERSMPAPIQDYPVQNNAGPVFFQ